MSLIRREDLLAAYDAAHKGPPGGARKLIEEAPEVDAVEVVHCRECKFAHMTYGGECKYCDQIAMLDGDGDPCVMYLPGDWYCAAGERGENSNARVL